MAWLQNLAGKAEDLLNKVDQNAARVLNEPIEITTNTGPSQHTSLDIKQAIEPLPEPTSSMKIDVDHLEEQIPNEITQMDYSQESDEVLTNGSAFEKIKSMTDSVGVISVSSSNSINIDMPDMAIKLEAQISRLEADNEELSKQILNMQHVHSQLQHDYSNLQTQLDRANETVVHAQNEMQEYKIRARRMLDDKEKMLPLQQADNVESQQIIEINQEVKNDLDNEIKKNLILETRLNTVTKELSALQQQYLCAQKENQRIQETLRASILNEKQAREDIEEENRITAREMQKLDKELRHAKAADYNYKTEIGKLEQQLQSRPVRNTQDADTQLQVLTQTLMHKQNTLDTTTSERNALKIQLEKLEHQYSQLCNQRIVRQPISLSITSDYDDTRIPRLVQVSPLDAGVTQRVKHAYSTLDAFSIRTGVFLRRYPLARIFLICYMLLLHLWVLFILFTYVPGTR